MVERLYSLLLNAIKRSRNCANHFIWYKTPKTNMNHGQCCIFHNLHFQILVVLKAFFFISRVLSLFFPNLMLSAPLSSPFAKMQGLPAARVSTLHLQSVSQKLLHHHYTRGEKSAPLCRITEKLLKSPDVQV